MFALEQFLIGFGVIHLAWLFFYISGTVVRKGPAEESPAAAVLSVVVASGSGMALTGLATFVLGLAHLIRFRGFALLLILLVIAFIVRGDSPFRASFWGSRFRTVGKAIRCPAIAVYVLAVVDALPATLPDRAFDALFFYSVVALEYASTHYLFVDNWVRDPYWTNNWVLVESWLYVFKVGNYLPFLTWLTGMLSMLGVFGAVSLELDRFGLRTKSTLATTYVVAGSSTAALLLNPMFLWLNSGGMLDVPLGFLLLVSGLGCYLGVRGRDASFVPVIVATAALLIGAKESFIVFLPLFFVSIWTLQRLLGVGRRSIVIALISLTTLSVPWYALNLIEDGDPVPPILNLALRGHDPKWSQQDNEQQLASLRHDRRNALGLLALPGDLFINSDQNLVSLGQTAICVLVMLPGAILAFSFIGGTIGLDLVVLAAVLLFTIAYWLLTSFHARYALLFDPLLCAFVGIVLLRVGRRCPEWGPALGVASLLLALPSPSSATWLSYFKNAGFLGVSAYTDRDVFLTQRITGYREAQFLSAELTRLGRKDHNVYVMNFEMLKYTFRQHGITEIGDWFGPEGYGNLIEAVDRGRVAAFLQGLDVDAIVVPSKGGLFSATQRTRFENQLREAGFSRSTCRGDDDIEMFIEHDADAPACAS